MISPRSIVSRFLSAQINVTNPALSKPKTETTPSRTTDPLDRRINDINEKTKKHLKDLSKLTKEKEHLETRKNTQPKTKMSALTTKPYQNPAQVNLHLITQETYAPEKRPEPKKLKKPIDPKRLISRPPEQTRRLQQEPPIPEEGGGLPPYRQYPESPDSPESPEQTKDVQQKKHEDQDRLKKEKRRQTLERQEWIKDNLVNRVDKSLYNLRKKPIEPGEEQERTDKELALERNRRRFENDRLRTKKQVITAPKSGSISIINQIDNLADEIERQEPIVAYALDRVSDQIESIKL